MNDETRDAQTDFMPPADGGSYIRNPDGSLTQVVKPTAPPPTPDELLTNPKSTDEE
jgi:hypothetical protein